MRTIGEAIKAVTTIVPAVYTATTSSETVVDTAGYDNVCFVINTGDIDLTTGNETYSFAIHESDNADGSSSSAITDASTTITADNQVKKIQVSGLGTGSRKRYMFARATLAGTTPSWPGSVTALLALHSFEPRQAPDASV